MALVTRLDVLAAEDSVKPVATFEHHDKKDEDTSHKRDNSMAKEEDDFSNPL